jgi:hypothetical protein
MRHEVIIWLYKCSQTKCDDIIAVLCVMIPFLGFLVALMIMPVGNGYQHDIDKRK